MSRSHSGVITSSSRISSARSRQEPLDERAPRSADAGAVSRRPAERSARALPCRTSPPGRRGRRRARQRPSRARAGDPAPGSVARTRDACGEARAERGARAGRRAFADLQRGAAPRIAAAALAIAAAAVGTIVAIARRAVQTRSRPSAETRSRSWTRHTPGSSARFRLAHVPARLPSARGRCGSRPSTRRRSLESHRPRVA